MTLKGMGHFCHSLVVVRDDVNRATAMLEADEIPDPDAVRTFCDGARGWLKNRSAEDMAVAVHIPG